MFEVGLHRVVFVLACDLDDTVDGDLLGDLEFHLRQLQVVALDPL